MKISYNWLKQFIKIDLKSEETAELLTDLGLEVEKVDKYQSIKGGLEGIVVGKVLSCEPHPDADRLKVTMVDLGKELPLQIVCGAANVAAGQKVLVATIGANLYDKDGVEFQIKLGKIRGQESHGMICAEDEIGLGNSHDGIMILNESAVIGTKAATLFNVENDEVFEIGLTPNRADAMSHLGTARDIRAGLIQRGINVEFITPSVSSFKVEKRILKFDIEVQEPKLAPRYCGVTISDIVVKPSPSWLQDRLKAIGIHPKNNVVDVTNYVMHELGQPLHAFDAEKINEKIIIKTLPSGTKFKTLDQVERTLNQDDLMICDIKGPLCIAGVFGGENSGVKDSTTSIFLESAYFDPITIRKTAKRHQLSTDASFRFERGIDPTITEYALKRAALLIQEVAGGEMTADIIDIYPKKIKDFSVVLNFRNVTKIIGQELPQETIKNILASLEIKVKSVSETGLGLEIPAYRVDVQREIDVIEEILRVYGYNNIKFSEKQNATMFNASRNEDYKVQNLVAAQLNAQGFYEIMCNSLTSASYLNISAAIKDERKVTIVNPLSNDLSSMRQTLLFSGLEALSYNINRKNSDLKFFEFGKTYQKFPSGFEEQKRLSLFLTGNRNHESWTKSQKPSDFFLFKGYVQSVLERAGIYKHNYGALSTDVFSEGISLSIGNETIVEFGTVKKSILKKFDIKQEVFFADLNWALLMKQLRQKIKYKEISRFHAARRDLSILLDDTVSFEKLHQLAFETDNNLLQEVHLFDFYTGNNLPDGKKSYAVSFTIQDSNKTLTDDQIDKVMVKIQKSLETELGASLR